MTIEEKELFVQSVKDVVRLIPQGRATSYGAIARAIGCPGMSRLVGRVMSGMGDGEAPAHRVVNSQGRLSGKGAFGSGNEMADLLAGDGVEVINDSVRNWRNVFWDPLREIEM